MRERVLVICPGRGTYGKGELGYLARHHRGKADFIAEIDTYRQRQGQPGIAALDGADKYQLSTHTAGENASALIYACAMCDYLSIDQDKYEPVAVTGNSMGWYIAMAAAGALPPAAAIEVINTMGSMMQSGVIGGQTLYPVVDAHWCADAEKRQLVLAKIDEIHGEADCELHLSINLGGNLVLGGNDKGLKRFEESVPRIDNLFPLRLYNHAAFHTPLLDEISLKAKNLLTADLFTAPRVPMIDGRGKIWQPFSTHIPELYDYTLGHQVNRTYDFSKALEVAVKEFAPQKLIILGPGTTLGGSVVQVLIQLNWQGLSSKADFIRRQQEDPLVISMGMPEQRCLVS